MKKVGIATVSTGYNYGSSLQAYATKKLLAKLGYEGELIRLKGGLVKGRDIRVKKLIVLVMRSLIHKRNVTSIYSQYSKKGIKSISSNSRTFFDDFAREYLQPATYSWGNLKKLAKSKDYSSFLCGSDQVWNGDTFYVDPLYYLEFAPKSKRIAFSPSFGRDKVADYNRKKIAKKIREIPYLSVREDVGCKIIRELTGKSSVVLVDPTLALSRDDWAEEFDLSNRIVSEPYILVYFLDVPSEQAKAFILALQKKLNVKVFSIPYKFNGELDFNHIDAGPIEFLKLVFNAEYVVTDSFHGTAFSMNFGVKFATFERNYGKSGNQSSRVISLLSKVDMMGCFEPNEIIYGHCQSSQAYEKLAVERVKSLKFLENSLYSR
ncbi:hypothetical protein NL53_05040 [Vibrio variabilis]|uniref:Polysaccharide pyruvyl transferase domain-containing protein n=1 Tax=Vibrio variabilis TaxID=990271 RepID=A0ABR4YDW3_9VIBR|nr:polysaccharide pyruvyl transferase family protein [Vibrio variabilis]KHA61683.1 hypothetical protein NL53_05040 [Vibrio variabilis]